MVDEVNIRLYEEKDLDDVNHLLEESFTVSKENIHGIEFLEVVAEVGQKVVGYLLLTKVLNPILKKSIYYVDYVCVDSNFRGREIGKKMLDYAYVLAKNEGIIYLQLTCSRFREAAHRLYEKCGYVKRESDIYRKEII